MAKTPFISSWLALGIPLLATAAPLRYAEDRAPSIVHPIYATSMSEARLNELVFDGLFTDDHELKSQPDLAHSFSLAADRKSMTIDLATDVKWHDGVAFTAKDVVFTVDAMKNPATASTETGRVAWIKKVTAVNDHQLIIEFVGEEYSPEDKLHFKILPAHRFSGTALKRTDAFRSEPIGTGPFKLTSFNGDNSITLQAADESAQLPEIQMREVADKNYQAKLIMYESLEALVRVLPRDIATLQADRRIELYPYQTNSWWYVGFNLSQERFKDAKVREALSLMVDVPALLAPIGTGDRVSGPFVPSSPFYNHDVAPVSADPEAAKTLLLSAGYTWVGRQWMKGDQPLKIRIAAPDNLETAQDVIINLQAQLQSQGVVVEPDFLGGADWKQRIWKDHDYDLVLSQWSFDRNEDIYEQFHSKGARNFGAYANPEVDRLLDEARGSADPQRKKALLRQVHALISKDRPMVFLWTLDSYSALSARLRNVVVHPFYFFTWASEWALK